MIQPELILRQLMMEGFEGASLLAAFGRWVRALEVPSASNLQKVQTVGRAPAADRPASCAVIAQVAPAAVPLVAITAPPENAKALARKAIAQSMLSPSTIALFSHLIERFNLVTWRCDPGSGSLADDLGLSVRQVRRSVATLVSSGLIGKSRHGGRAFANAYVPNWPLIVERAAEGDIEAKRPTLSAKPANAVTQNHLTKPDSDSMMGKPQRKRASVGVDRRQGYLPLAISGGRDKSEDAVRDKLKGLLHQSLNAIGKSAFVEGVTRSIEIDWLPAIHAEMRKAGTGLPILLEAIRDAGSSWKATG